MTIAVLVKVFDGVVLAADSATTLTTVMPDGHVEVANIYNNANKIFNLRNGLPIAAMTWGLGNIGEASIATLSKDLRSRFTGDDPSHIGWHLDPATYAMEQVVERTVTFFSERYAKIADDVPANGQDLDALGLLVAGYSAGADQPEAWQVHFTPAGVIGPEQLLAGESGASWWGQPEAITRLLNGTSTFTAQALVNLGVPETQAGDATGALIEQVAIPMVSPAMPIRDAIDLAEFLVDTTIKFTRFSPGHPTVGGPIEVAAVTKHEQFKWVSRKHYYDSRLNPAQFSDTPRHHDSQEGM